MQPGAPHVSVTVTHDTICTDGQLFNSKPCRGDSGGNTKCYFGNFIHFLINKFNSCSKYTKCQNHTSELNVY